jgi:hypothetical protein
MNPPLRSSLTNIADNIIEITGKIKSENPQITEDWRAVYHCIAHIPKAGSTLGNVLEQVSVIA